MSTTVSITIGGPVLARCDEDGVWSVLEGPYKDLVEIALNLRYGEDWIAPPGYEPWPSYLRAREVVKRFTPSKIVSEEIPEGIDEPGVVY